MIPGTNEKTAINKMEADDVTESGKRRLEEPEAEMSGKLQHGTTKRIRSGKDREKVRELNRERIVKWRANQLIESRNSTRSSDRIRKLNERANETPEENQQRLSNARIAMVSTRARANQGELYNAAFNYDTKMAYEKLPIVQIGMMNNKCSYCHALKFPGEPAGLCCSKGQVKLPPLEPPPEPLQSLVKGTHADSKHFLVNIRKYNACFQMTSFGATRQIRESGYMPTFKVQGQVYHLVGSLLPLENSNPHYMQIYFVGDSRDETNARCSNVPDVKNNIVLSLQTLLHEHNRYVTLFKTALEQMPADTYKVVIKPDRTPAGEHVRRFNAPTIDEVAVLMVDNQHNQRDIVLQKRSSQLIRVVETHRSYDALQYPLIFWRGDDGYNFGIPRIDQVTGEPQAKKVSAMDFYAFRIMIREGDENILLRFRQLFHQFIVDMYAKIESERLLFIRLNQKKLRVDEYAHLKDATINDARPGDLGKMVILPATFQGSPRHMHEYTQDALTYVRHYGRPDLFITFTCNPLWTEIKHLLFSDQSPSDRHDLIARVFKQKLSILLKLITKTSIFGETIAWLYSIEWQKRGLPHSHMLVWLKNHIRGSDMDKVICAEIPDKDNDPFLYDVVTTQMIHGPCGKLNPRSSCMNNGKCTKNYPKQFLQETQTGNDGYPQYRRRNPREGGFTTKIKMKTDTGFCEVEIDNRWVVPYCPLLTKIFQAHINVESCQSVKAIKYMLKYVNKGSDQAVFEVSNSSDEVEQFLMGRYISSNEAIWRILGFPIHERSPTVMHLSVHLENGQRIYFTEENLHSKLHSPPITTLTAFFELCREDSFARTLFYFEVPRYYTWEASKKAFKRRKQGKPVEGYPDVRASDALGRVYTVHPSNAECFYLRMLLHVVKGPTSFVDLKNVDGQVCETYRESCLKRGLLEDDDHWESTLTEASATHSAVQLRQLFGILLTTCSLASPIQLWEKFKEELCEDIIHNLRRQNPEIDVQYSANVFNNGLIQLEDICLTMAGKSINQLGLPSPKRDESNPLCTEILRETSYDSTELKTFVEEKQLLLTADQKTVYEEILWMINNQTGGILFLDAPGGTGKTFVINLLLAKVRQQSEIALAVASSGIAATLLTGGRTAHSAFKLPLQMTHCDMVPTCNISKGSGLAQLLQQCKLIVWDECTMAHKYALEALDQTLRDLRSNDHVMGGVPVLLAGDFRQTLPVVPRSTPADEINACLKASHLWRTVRKLSLSTNMRVHLLGDDSAGRFSEQLIALGEGKLPVNVKNGMITLPTDFCCMVASQQVLQSKVFTKVQHNFKDMDWLCERVILASKNDAVFRINKQLLDQLPGECTSYNAVDTVQDPAESIHYPTEFLNSLQPSGIPPYKLELKAGAPIMLLRNLQPPKLCNGTRLIIKNLFPHLIEAIIATGIGKGEEVFIPRIPLLPTDLPFSFRRLQFPISLAFAISINKSQGQSLKVVGVDLMEPCFSHGQLYVACSRVGNPRNLFIYAPEGQTKNVVYKSALT